MKSAPQQNLLTAALFGVLALTPIMVRAADPLPSWRNPEPKAAIVSFVEKVTKEGSTDFVPVPERIAAFDNSDGDFQMLEWTTSGTGPRFAMIIHHDDAEREVAYDRESHLGKIDKCLDEAPKRGWAIASMKNAWNHITPESNP